MDAAPQLRIVAEITKDLEAARRDALVDILGIDPLLPEINYTVTYTLLGELDNIVGYKTIEIRGPFRWINADKSTNYLSFLLADRLMEDNTWKPVVIQIARIDFVRTSDPKALENVGKAVVNNNFYA